MADRATEVVRSAPDQRLLLRIADITASLTSDGSCNLGVDREKGKFVVAEGLPDVSIKTYVGSLPEFSVDNRLFDAGIVWQLHMHRGSYLFSFRSIAFGSRPYKIAVFDPDFSRGEVYLHPDFSGRGQPVDPLWSPLDELMFGSILARGKGAEIHACGLIDPQGRGSLFVGASGAGKTTMARLWRHRPGSVILSDDRIILRRSGGEVWMYGTPWHGEGGMAAAAGVPLTRIFFLRKGSKNALVPVCGIHAASRLFACSFPPIYDREGVDFTLKFLGEVVQEVPCHELSVVPDERVVEFVEKIVPVQAESRRMP